jgi:hypothetical protein
VPARSAGALSGTPRPETVGIMTPTLHSPVEAFARCRWRDFRKTSLVEFVRAGRESSVLFSISYLTRAGVGDCLQRRASNNLKTQSILGPVRPLQMRFRLCILFFALTAFTSAKGRDQLYAATGFAGSTGELYILNPVDGSVITDVGPLNDLNGNNYGLTGLRHDPSTGLLYGITGSSPTAPTSLVLVDPSNALVLYIGGPFASRLSDIAIDPFTFIMYAVSGSSKYFYTVDKLTGLATRTGNTTTPPKRGGGFTANSRGALYGTNDKTLYTYDKVTGAATAVGNTNLLHYVDALAFSATGVLYGSEGGGSSNSDRERWLVVIDPATGAAVELGSTVGDLNALAFIPAP